MADDDNRVTASKRDLEGDSRMRQRADGDESRVHVDETWNAMCRLINSRAQR